MAELIDQLSLLARTFQNHLRDNPALRAAGLPGFQARVIAFFARHPGASPQALAKASGRDKAQVARAIKELESRDLLTRSHDAKDRRVACLMLSPSGEELAAALLEQRQALGAAMLEPLSQTERDSLGLLLDKMLARLHSLERTDS